MPFGFHLAMDTLPSEGLLLRPTTRYRQLDIALLIRVPEGLQPSRTTRCSAHTTPAADFYRTVRVNRFTLSHDSVTCSRSPEVSSIAFHAQPLDLPPVSLMDVGFAIICPLARHRRPQIQFLSIGSRACSTLLSDLASPLALALRYHFTSIRL
jgi:hypothetical protein